MEEYETDEVFGITRHLPLNYVERSEVDDKLREDLGRGKHIVVYGASKQGKTCLRKHCLGEGEYIVVHCNNKWNLSDIHSSILKEAGYRISVSEKTAISGKQKIKAKIRSGIFSGSSETSVTGSKEKEKRELELDPENVNGIIQALEQISFDKYIVLEDFHYLPEDTQKSFAVSLKAFHEASDISFMIVGVWLEENRLIVKNGDLTGRVIAVNADRWRDHHLKEVIKEGEDLLNISLGDNFKRGLISNCFDSVSIVQEVCREACKQEGILSTQSTHTVAAQETNPKKLVSSVVGDQSARYDSFLVNFSAGFRKTELEMYMWLLYPILTADTERLEEGLPYRELRNKIERYHPEGGELNPGNLTQSLNSTASLQVDIDIKPIILDYDQTNKRLSVVDRGFLIWLANQDQDYLLERAGLSTYID